jgi:hypothetical protein
VTVRIVRRGQAGDIKDYEVVLLGITGVSASRARPDPWPDSFTAATYGGPTDLWNATLSPATISTTLFGVGISATQVASGNVAVHVDEVAVSITYCED